MRTLKIREIPECWIRLTVGLSVVCILCGCAYNDPNQWIGNGRYFAARMEPPIDYSQYDLPADHAHLDASHVTGIVNGSAISGTVFR